MPGPPTNLDNSKAINYCACSRCGLASFCLFLTPVISRFFVTLSLSGRRLVESEKLSQRTFEPNQSAETA